MLIFIRNRNFIVVFCIVTISITVHPIVFFRLFRVSFLFAHATFLAGRKVEMKMVRFPMPRHIHVIIWHWVLRVNQTSPPPSPPNHVYSIPTSELKFNSHIFTLCAFAIRSKDFPVLSIYFSPICYINIDRWMKLFAKLFSLLSLIWIHAIYLPSSSKLGECLVITNFIISIVKLKPI